jgi:hypothetical protein
MLNPPVTAADDAGVTHPLGRITSNTVIWAGSRCIAAGALHWCGDRQGRAGDR